MARVFGFWGSIAGVLACLVAVAFAPAASAMTVNTTADDSTPGNGSCSLREAIVAASAGSSTADCGPAGSTPIAISVPEGTYELSAGQLAVGTGANIAIVGANSNAPALTTIDAAGHSRVLEVASGAQVKLSALEITGGQTPSGADGASPGQSGGFGGDGGGILNSGTLTLERVWVLGNFTGHGGRGVDGDQSSANSTRYGKSGGSGGNGGGIYNGVGASLTLTASTIGDNGTGDGGNGGNGAAGQTGLGKFPYGSDGGSGGPAGSGGGILNAGSATLADTTIEGNFTGRGGNGGPGGQGVAEGEMQPAGRGGYGGDGGNSGLTYNLETGNPQYSADLGGGGIYNLGSLHMSRSTIAGNNTGAGGNGGGAGIGGKKTNNQYETGAHAGAGGGGGLGGGLFNFGKGATLTNVTIAENLTGDGGKGGNGPQSGSLGPGLGGFGGYGGGVWAEGAHSPDYLELVQVTISGNSLGAAGPAGDDASFPGTPGQRGKGAGVAVGPRYDAGTGGGVYFKNTVVAGNGSSLAGDANCIQYYPKEQYVDLKDLGNNLSYPDSSCPGTVANPLLGPLQDNGGLTETMLPEAGSGAIGLVPLVACTVHEDQRGFTRPGNGSSCDAGAVETGSAPSLTSTSTVLASSANPSVTGQAVKYTATVSPQPSGGTVGFTDAGSPISGCGAVSVGPGGQAFCTVTYSVAGSHPIKAGYGGDSLFTASSSNTLTQVVQNAQEPSSPGGGGGAPIAAPLSTAIVLPPTSPAKKVLRCPKTKKRVVRNGKARCVPKPKPHAKGNRHQG
jgi:CSLREA domain-containing protein